MSNQLFQPDAETAVLSLILQNPLKLQELRLVPKMFSSTPNQVLFSTITELVESGLVPEINLIDSFLKSKGRDQESGGREYLNYLFKQSYSIDNLKEFERIIADSFKARTLIDVATNLPDRVIKTENIDNTISSLQGVLNALMSSSGGDTTFSLHEILRSSYDRIASRIANPGIRGVSTGYTSLDYATAGLNPGELWFIAGRPGMGKTASILNLILNQARLGIPTLMLSYEIKEDALSERLIAVESGINAMNIRLGLLDQKQLDSLSEAIKRLKDLPFYIDAGYNTSLEYVVATIRRFVKTRGVKVVYIDYIQLMTERNDDSTHELGRISRRMKLLANELGVTIIILSQLSRKVEERNDRRPIMSDLRQSGNMEEDADIVIGLYRDKVYHKDTKAKDVMELIIIKQRNGPTGSIFLKFDEETNKLSEK